MWRPVAVIPVYNHDRPLAGLLDRLLAFNVPCIVVDDASDAASAAAIDGIVARHPEQVTLVRHAQNQGKGGAVLTGLARAFAMHFTHALQIDADGQHAVDDVPTMLQLSQTHPTAMITGQPIFDDSVPRVRLYLRYLTHIMVSVNTLHVPLRDAMCGFRVYPVRRVLALARRVALGRRMDFDIEILVRLDWAGVPIVLQPTQVRYPLDGVSHFRLWLDNARITSLHTRLFFGMLRRAPQLLRRASAPA
jgi:glycosyltransferase involved in cell wall biosynthesis